MYVFYIVSLNILVHNVISVFTNAQSVQMLKSFKNHIRSSSPSHKPYREGNYH